MIEHEHNGITFKISQKVIDELKKVHNVDALSDIELAIEKEQAVLVSKQLNTDVML
jgi:hypothetical protein